MMEMIAYRPMKVTDIEAGLSLCRAAGWNQVARDWELFLRLDPSGCVVAEESSVVGTVATVRYQDRFSWIGMVLVDPAYRGRGIGTSLMSEALKLLQNEKTIKLDATSAGRRVYRNLGFVDEISLSRMVSPGISAPMPVVSASLLETGLLHTVNELDREVFGADRRALLEWLLAGEGAPACWALENGEVQGYCMSRAGHNFMQIGPLVANDTDIARDLVCAALNRRMNHPVAIDVPHIDQGWIEWLTTAGFREQRRFTRMRKGSSRFPGDLSRQFAIAGPEFG